MLVAVQAAESGSVEGGKRSNCNTATHGALSFSLLLPAKLLLHSSLLKSIFNFSFQLVLILPSNLLSSPKQRNASLLWFFSGL